MVLHVGFDLGDQLDVKCLVEAFKVWLREMPFVTEELPDKLTDQLGKRFAVIHISRCQENIECFAAVVEYQVQLEAKEPTRGGFTPFSQPSKYLVRSNALVETDVQCGRVDKGNAHAITKTGSAGIDTQRNQGKRNEFYKPGKADQARKLTAQIW